MDRLEYEQFIQKYSRLRPNNYSAAIILFGVSTVSVLGFALSLSSNGACWFLGQVILGISILQWFVLLHDFGHGRFFTQPWLNAFFGLFASNICLLPFYPWRCIHAKHHVWTGWKDLDPTMTVRGAQSSPFVRMIADISWRLWIPTFSVSFAVYNFWYPGRLFRLWPDSKVRLSFVLSIALPILVYGAAFAFFGYRVFHFWGIAFLIYVMLADPLLISQHSHISTGEALGKTVNPYRPMAQDVFTRSLVFPSWVSKYILIHFDNHVSHHLLPNLACYHLKKIPLSPVNKSPWFEWILKAKKMDAQILVFKTEAETGIRL